MTNSLRQPLAVFAAGVCLLFSAAVQADSADAIRADGHAPIGVMGDHMHSKGEWMFSYRFMRMDMDGNRIGTDRVSPDFIVQNVNNRFFGMPMQPPTLRVVPLDMTMDMHMVGTMYAPTDNLTLALMLNYHRKEMDHVTYMGPTGTEVLGTFTTRTDGLGDTYLGGLYRLYDSATHKLHLNFGVTAPTGDIEEEDDVLTPMGMRPTVRLPYSMQLGSGTWDVKPGLTYNGRSDAIGWGAQYMGTVRTGENDENYTLGDVHEFNVWSSYSPRPWVSLSWRVAFRDEGSIDGMDPRIMGPVQTADPDNFGGESWFGYLGVNLAGQDGWTRGHRIALELGWSIDQDLNGPQMETDNTITLGWQYAP